MSDRTLQEQVEALPELSAPKRWLRFGDIPASGRSKNHLTKEDEAGVSVYEAVEKDGVALPILPSLTASACVSLSGVLERKAHWVTGRVVGRGSDGETLLVDAEEVRG